MFKKQSGFASLELIIILFIITAVTGAGYFVLHSRQSDSKPSQASVSTQPATKITQQQAFTILEKVYNDRLASSQKECPSFEQNCLGDSLTTVDKISIAQAYGVSSDPEDTLFFGLQKGSSLDIGGIGTGYLNNKSQLAINDNDWYWEIGACSNNHRIYINAATGTTAGIHDGSYCTKNTETQ